MHLKNKKGELGFVHSAVGSALYQAYDGESDCNLDIAYAVWAMAFATALHSRHAFM
jgi:hypothetical protein